MARRVCVSAPRAGESVCASRNVARARVSVLCVGLYADEGAPVGPQGAVWF